MLTTAAVFSDHMVLQRGKPIPVWGACTPGEPVTVTLGGEKRTAYADQQGDWMAVLPPMDTRESLTLTVRSDTEELRFSDAVLGEVWLAGGQSNMEMALRDCRDARREIRLSAERNVRFYTVPRCPTEGPEWESAQRDSRWRAASPDTAGDLSGAAWFFAVQIAEALQVPVGIIDCCWGGTSVSCWMGEPELRRTAAGQEYLTRWRDLAGEKTLEDYRREMAAYNELWSAWDDKVQALRREDPHVSWPEIHRLCGECPWPQPAGPGSPFRPAGLYKTMLRPVCPYGLRGFLYYQGEEDADRFDTYDRMMAGLIDQWRGDWGDMELPFLFVQLPMYCSAEDYAAHRDNCHWAALRERQWKVSRTVAGTGLAVLIDGGEFDNIHPSDKRTVGTRLALLARRQVYGQDVVADGPVPVSVLPRGRTLEVRFRNTAGALAFSGDLLEGFALAGPDGVYWEARGEIHADTVVLTSERVPEPVTVRYAWTNFGPATLRNAAGLPAVPFRTDSFPVE